MLIQSKNRSIPPLQQTLSTASIPINIADNELPLSREPTIRPMLLALQTVADPKTLTVNVMRTLALSPLDAIDTKQLQRLARILRRQNQKTANNQRLPRSSNELLRETMLNPLLLDKKTSPAKTRFATLGERLLKARNIVTANAAPDEIIWSL